MQSELCIIEVSLVAMALPPEKEEAYWEAIRVVVDLLINEAQSWTEDCAHELG